MKWHLTKYVADSFSYLLRIITVLYFHTMPSLQSYRVSENLHSTIAALAMQPVTRASELISKSLNNYKGDSQNNNVARIY